MRRWAFAITVLLICATAIHSGSALGAELDWASHAGGAAFDGGFKIGIDGSGNSYVTGRFQGTATFGAGEANETVLSAGQNSEGDPLKNLFVAKYSSSGHLVWVRRATQSQSSDITVDGAGNSYVAGFASAGATFNPGQSDEATFTVGGPGFLAKYDTAGGLVAVRPINSAGIATAERVALDPSGHVYVAGRIGGASTTFGAGGPNETTLTNAGVNDVYVAKFTTDHGLIWAKRAGGNDFDGPGSIAVDTAANVYLTGIFRSSAITFGLGEPNETTLTAVGDAETFVAKFQSNGALTWAKRIGSAGSEAVVAGTAVGVDGGGNVYVSGVIGGGHSATFGPGEVHETTLTNSDQSVDGFVAKFNPSGLFIWVNHLTGSVSVRHGVTNGNGDTYITGDSNPGFFVARYASDGSLVWVRQATGSSSGAGVAVDGAGHVHITGEFQGSIIFESGEADETQLGSVGGSDLFVVRYFDVDTSAPTVLCDAADGIWHNVDVAIACTATDADSGLANPADASFNLLTSVPSGTETAAGLTSSRQVCNNDDLCTTAGPIGGNKVDKKAPVPSCASADGVWHAADITLACTATDGGSGLASPSDASFSLSTSVPAGTETTAASTTSRTVCDTVGNCTTAGPIGGNKVDKKAPAITITTPGANVTYPFKGKVAANYACVDGGSGVGLCQGPVANGTSIDTTSMGAKTFAVTSRDNAGNESTLSVSYTVGPAGGGSLQPTTTILSSTPNPSVVGQAVTFTATVTASGGGNPTGAVSFKDGGKVIGTATLNSGQAVFVISTLKKGSQRITAVYGGDGAFATSTSPIVTQVVQ